MCKMAKMANFKVGDIVWAKMKSFQAWPAEIIEPKPEVKRPAQKKPHHFVLFFGSKNFAWVCEDSIWPFQQYRAKFTLTNRVPKGFREAIESVDDCLRSQPEPKTGDDHTKIKQKKDSMGNNKSVDKLQKEKKEKKLKRSSSPSGQKSLASKKQKLVVKIPSPVPKKMDSDNEKSTNKSTKSPPSPSPDSKLPSWVMKPSRDTPPRDDGKYDFSDDDFESGTQSQIDRAVNAVGAFDKSATSTDSSTPRSGPPGQPISPSQHNTSNSTNTSLSDTPTGIRSLDSVPAKNIIPTPMKIGYLGLGIMGQGMVMNLLKSGHEVTVWNRTSHKCRDFVKLGALRGNSPCDVVQSCDITFSCVSDPQALRDLVFGNSGVNQGIRPGKSFVDMSTVDVDTCTDIYEAVTAKGGRFLEAPVVGSRQPAHEGRLVILAAGDKSLFDDCYSCFEAMGKKAFFLGDVGNGARMKLLSNMISGVMVAGLAEGMALAERVGVKQEDLLDILSMGDMDSHLLRQKGQAILIDDFDPNCPLQHQQKDLRLAIGLGDTVDQPLPVTAAANELYKKAKAIGYGENDVSAVYKVTYL
ncbi:cytokine-like nuclear factor N-PAC isoform X2 [Lineus longissimus]|uniref:cytokine-like nuclear factor N-PAC isoform X2 n=1 Tax=Lineus longissimus TaxID=88925 RepID=UPI00315C5C91